MKKIMYFVFLATISICCYFFGVGLVQFFELDPIVTTPIGIVTTIIIFIISNIISDRKEIDIIGLIMIFIFFNILHWGVKWEI